ncbi:kinesin, putative [Trypanosoma brucei gambiense DAL972]|uniref:Kinesin, putative n=2 Tax=Trypanosoma brucei TaxID=5691 RepID=D0A0L8_TRYB9|nr:kinesin, putative [Trypanosoma brucei gambiense DAL972]CBH16776.1 kinesin, putative [Trypanosoma brucei gambiense DAL972]|eukprot:XP_011779040.1 kinesin, putative [Trypanosoma brucei gambiense DAL972]
MCDRLNTMSIISPRSAAPSSGRRLSASRRGQDREYRRTNSSRSVLSQRQKLSDSIHGTGNAMDVYVRVRPFSERELSMNAPQHSTVRIEVDNPCVLTLLDPQKDFKPRQSYSFTRCFWSVLESDSADCGNAGDILSAIGTYIDRRVASPRSARQRQATGNSSRSHSARGKGSGDFSGFVETSGSNAALLTVNTVPHPPYSSQADVYNEVGRPLLENSLLGYNGCIFAYGQTGSGKTFTMLGYTPKASDFRRSSRRQQISIDEADGEHLFNSSSPRRTATPLTSNRLRRTSWKSNMVSPRDTRSLSGTFRVEAEQSGAGDDNKPSVDPNELQGIIPRITRDLFQGLHEVRHREASHSFRVELEFYEIYNEKVYDLINPQKDADLKIRQNPLTGPYVEGLSSLVVVNEVQVAEVINRGSVDRHTSCTRMNDRSSRSHAIITINILQLSLDGKNSSCQKRSKLNLVDLAGSERIGASGVEGLHFKESTKINLSLTTLGRVIDCLAELSQSKVPSVTAPYRDSNLTWLLMDSLGGNSKTSMVATISPHCSNFEEMRQTIRYASRARQIVNVAVVNEDPHVRQINMLTNEVENLKKVIRENGMNEFTRDYVIDLRQRYSDLEKRCVEQQLSLVQLRAEIEENTTYNRQDEPTPVSGRATRVFRADLNGRRTRNNVNGDEADALTVSPRVPESRRSAAAAWPTPPKSSPCNNSSRNSNAEVTAELRTQIKRLKDGLNTVRVDSCLQQYHVKEFALSYTTAVSNAICDTVIKKNKEFLGQATLLFGTRAGRRDPHLRPLSRTPRRDVDDSKKVPDCRSWRPADKAENDSRCVTPSHAGKAKRGDPDAALAIECAKYQTELQRVRDELGSAIVESQRTSEVLRRLQYEREDLKRKNEEISSKYEEKEREVRQLKRLLESGARSREEGEGGVGSATDWKKQADEELNCLRAALQKMCEEHSRVEQQHQAEIHSLISQQDRLFNISSSLLANWESRSAALDSSFAQLRALLHNKEYQSQHQRLRDSMLERRNYSAEVAAVDERKRRDTQRLREIMEQLKQNQKDSKASIQKFEEDVRQHFSGVRTAREGNGGESSFANPHSSRPR